MLTKSYTEHGLNVPEDLKSWDLEKARKVATYFTAWKADKAAGKGATQDDLTSVLEAYEAFAGELQGVQTGVENLKPRKTEPKAVKPEPEAPEVQPSDDTVDEAAVTLLQEKLGATVISHGVVDGAKCEVCGEPIDDKDIANLGIRRFKRALCVMDYKESVKAAKH
jgi:hypothetical protein